MPSDMSISHDLSGIEERRQYVFGKASGVTRRSGCTGLTPQMEGNRRGSIGKAKPENMKSANMVHNPE